MGKLEGERAHLRTSCLLPWLLLYMAVVAVVGCNWRGMRDSLDAAQTHLKGEGVIGGGTGAVARSNNSTDHITNITLSESESNTSFFDCNRNKLCRWFYPGKFYHEYFIAHVKQQNSTSSSESGGDYYKWRKQIGLENANLPALNSLSWWLHNVVPTNHSTSTAIQNHINLPCNNITYIHLHKCGGTSIQGALYRRARQIRNTHLRIINDTEQQLLHLQADVHTFKHSFGGGSREKKRQRDRERLGHIHAIAANMQSSRVSPFTSFPIFTVVRDPINRFLSAIQQVMHYNTEFREKCLHEHSSGSLAASSLLSKKKREEREARLRRKTIQCAMLDMEETNYRRDVHLLPMASHFRLLDDVDGTGYDGEGNHVGIAVSVFYMDDIDDVLHYLGGEDDKNDSNISGSNAFHARDRSDVDYATSTILARLSTKDCTEEMIQQICRLYHVDVEFMKWLGFGGEAIERCA